MSVAINILAQAEGSQTQCGRYRLEQMRSRTTMTVITFGPKERRLPDVRLRERVPV
jgi:hypothetical protein